MWIFGFKNTKPKQLKVIISATISAPNNSGCLNNVTNDKGYKNII